MLENKKNPANSSSCVPLALMHLHKAADVPGYLVSPRSDRTPSSEGPAPVTMQCATCSNSGNYYPKHLLSYSM